MNPTSIKPFHPNHPVQVIPGPGGQLFVFCPTCRIIASVEAVGKVLSASSVLSEDAPGVERVADNRFGRTRGLA